ncbi:MAG: biosynthetic-type acetolactate synthase large subunit [Flavobacteriales bacterium]|nr:biosynthetic-type acetolactate synthase large subunit [Flavobacteriales bacterium]
MGKTADTKKATKPRKKEMLGSEAILEALIHEGVDTIFGYPGGAIMPIYDALYNYKDKLRHILVRHEQGATHAAEGYAKMKGHAGVCFATSGPGATNLVTGIADAMLDSIPMVCITGQVADHLLGMDAFQETDVIGVTMPVTKWNFQITNAEEIPQVIAKAFYIANSGKPGPVLIDVTKNAQFQKFKFAPQEYKDLKSYNPFKNGIGTSVEEAAKLINKAKSPMMFVGNGVLISKAEKVVRKFAEKTGIPVASTLHGLSVFPTSHPLYVGMLGMHGNYGPNYLSDEADLVLAVGMRFDDRVTGDVSKFLPNAKIIHVEIDAAEVGKIMKPTVTILSDAKRAMTQLLAKVKEKKHTKWHQKFVDCYDKEFKQVISKETHPKKGEIKMAEVIRRLSEQTKGKAVIVPDVGQHQMMAARYYKFAQTDSFVTSGGLGTMGFSLPAAFGVKTGAPNRTVISISGDGGFQMNIQELGTIAQENADVKIVILNNSFLGMVRQWQGMFFEKRYSFVNLVNPEFTIISKGYGIPAQKVTERKDLDAAIETMLKYKGAYMLEIMVEQEEDVFPMIPTGAAVRDIRLK